MALGDVLSLVRDRRWDTLILLTMMFLVTIMMPFFIAGNIEKAIDSNESIQRIDANIETMEGRISSIEEIQFSIILDDGIAGYKKIDGDIEKLQTNTQNAMAIKRALTIPRIREILFSMDPANTRLYEEYFSKGV